MANWCADNLRNLQTWKAENLEMTASSDLSTKYFDATLRQLVSWMDCEQLGGIVETVNKMVESDPEFLMGRVLMLGLDVMGTSRSVHVDEKFRDDLATLCRVTDCTPRERLHASAINRFANGDMQGACIEWEKILAKHPNDLMALKFAHDAYFFMGDNIGKRDSVERVIDKWSPQAPCYSYLHGMYAFGLEECGEYELAEVHARRALSLNRHDCWATHALSHCYEMRSDYANGIQMLESTVDDWSPCYMLACHNYWHNAIFYLEKGDVESALSIFDDQIIKRTQASGMALDFVDAASILTRIEMESGRNTVGADRWRTLRPLASRHVDDHVLAFNDAHISMALSALDRFDSDGLAEEHLGKLDAFIGGSHSSTNDNWRLTRDIGAQLSAAICDFNASQYENAFDKLYPLRTQIYRIGGSHAQRDVFNQILIHSAIRSTDPQQQHTVNELLQEREALKTNSEMAKRLLEKHKADHKDHE